MATKQRATAFAMITLGIGELMATAALMFHHFFGGEGGVTTNRMIDQSLFGLSYASGIQVYYLILAWTLIAAVADVFPDTDPARPHGERLRATISSARSSSATTRAWCASCSSRCRASLPASAAGCTRSPTRS